MRIDAKSLKKIRPLWGPSFQPLGRGGGSLDDVFILGENIEGKAAITFISQKLTMLGLREAKM